MLGSGRRVGENMEQFWALVRAVMKLTRYMTKQGYTLGLDDVMLQIADDKLLEFVQSVLSAHKACLKKLGKCLQASPLLLQLPLGFYCAMLLRTQPVVRTQFPISKLQLLC